ncbi:hypothetical protein SEA_FORZA_102 [Gordonia phage Forza]|uniref:Uncharacterized protein n=1 Tax=Gordonia phage Forza TaxID=2571247 RepID=A0A650EZH4_9CAUD|nr:hypothetical protein PP303_gp102 [Gordonia phage Forza]QEM41569.1 hypothetical protein SEA_BOOPY_102 [Gordonia phage Boopy]QGT55095.1 hypothetical protein SEA_FORZA_102 [Gordonia phage Forza]UXE04243.1 hypothetical protein SEA_BLUENGOLD_101 [Gordonia phage BlueNGold]WBF03883.1 hypothetical protein SEA_MAREELIH_100 [Gordonia phage Mareelih]
MTRIKLVREFIGRNNHLIQAWIWIALGVPSVLFWKESVLWVILMSLYANAEASFSAHQAKKAEREARERV